MPSSLPCLIFVLVCYRCFPCPILVALMLALSVNLYIVQWIKKMAASRYTLVVRLLWDLASLHTSYDVFCLNTATKAPKIRVIYCYYYEHNELRKIKFSHNIAMKPTTKRLRKIGSNTNLVLLKYVFWFQTIKSVTQTYTILTVTQCTRPTPYFKGFHHLIEIMHCSQILILVKKLLER